MHTLYLDCSSGISGDMIVAALLDLGASEGVLRTALSSLPLDGYRIEIADVIKSGLHACDFNVILDQDNHDHDMAYLHGHEHAPEQTHPHGQGHSYEPSYPHGQGHSHEQTCPRGQGHSHEQTPSHEHGHGRSLRDITEILSAGQLTPHALELALKIFRIVAEAESQVHGKSLEEVHFHEVGAVDSIVDIAAVAVCIDNLGIDRVILPALTEGTGLVRCQHGLLPVPVPATTAIVAKHQIPLHITHIQGELVTPTGAAIAAALRTDDALPEEFKILRTGLGAGKRQYETAGILRAMLIEDTGVNQDKILVIETNMDDCRGETMGFVMEQLLAGGALDVFYTPIYMKKHRPAYKLSVLCPREKRKEMETLIFRHSTTIGLRVHEAWRTKLPRRILSLETPWGMADVKICQFEEDIYCYPESDSVEKLALENHASYSELYYKIKQFAMDNYSSL